ncbi:MAG: DEAD/DEAH box helicase, partial [Pirellulaceae bacterium]|nr:DEAD/DEAH box helicase [Pirellulaceae bacterium]
MPSTTTGPASGLAIFHPPVRAWFEQSFDGPTEAQLLAWPSIAAGENTLLLAPTGSGKTLAAFLVAIERIMFGSPAPGVKALYISPLKALGVDVERNLRAPIAGVRAAASRAGAAYHDPAVAVRSGDTPADERLRLARQAPDILITTPESLYLLLTSRARSILTSVQTVIIDEIHALAATKRGSHLFVSLERLEQLRRDADPGAGALQRIGLSATQRPLEEIARLLGGAELPVAGGPPVARPVAVIEAGRRRQLELRIEVPVEDMARLGEPQVESGPAAAGPALPSIWPAIHPRLVDLIRQHRSTMIFANSRRLAERLAAAINELAEEELALAHHGSIAKDARQQIEDRLKRGQLRAIVATSSLELGIDMGAVDLVIQIEAPPSIAAGIQRIGRSGHQVGGRSTGVVFPKYRGDLLTCSAAAGQMVDGLVESTRYPRNPLDVLAQQLVAMVAVASQPVDQLYDTVRRAAPFHDLPRTAFEGVLDMLAGRYPSDEFAELRPRLNWDRLSGQVTARPGAQRLAVLNAGTIPDRGLYGVFLADGQSSGSRVGELDEEMVFETHAGDVFLLGASSWRVLEITDDRVLVAPAPGEPGRMPFWRGDGPGRPCEFGRAIGQFTRQIARLPREQALARLAADHALDDRAANNLVQYLHEQVEATGELPSDRAIVVECFVDEVGDWRVAVLSPFGARVHAPWATAVAGRLREQTVGEVDLMWTDDGMAFRLPESDEPPRLELFFPGSDEIEDLVVQQLGSTALFAARFRENAARALLLPRRQPNRRSPLWLQRRRAADLLAVAARYPDFPILLETYRECLKDVFDVQALKELLRDVERQAIRVALVTTDRASPFAASLMFNYVGKFIYDGDAPLAERRAAALALDHAQLRELLGDAELRELLDAGVVDELALELQWLRGRQPPRHADAVHDLLQQLGDLSREELQARCDPGAVAGGQLDEWLRQLMDARRALELRIAGQQRYVAAEDAARYRDALGAVLPAGLPAAFLQPVADPLGDLVSRFARTHVPFQVEQLAERLGLGIAPLRETLARLAGQNRLLEGEFLPGGRGREWCHRDVLRLLKGRSLARLRRQVAPVAQHVLTRFLAGWHQIAQPRRGLDGLLDAVEQLQGLPLPARTLEDEILPRRVRDYRGSQLDELCAAGEIVWRGFERLGAEDGRIALYLTDHFSGLAPAPDMPADELAQDEIAARIDQLLQQRGALFFDDIQAAIGGFRNDLLEALWRLVWQGRVTNDTLAPLRSLRSQRKAGRDRSGSRRTAFRSRRLARPPGSEGRWTRLSLECEPRLSATERQMRLALQLVQRYGIVTRETVAAEGVRGGFAALYPVFKALEEAGKVRRGYFVEGLGAAQFAAPGADDRLRQFARDTEQDEL